MAAKAKIQDKPAASTAAVAEPASPPEQPINAPSATPPPLTAAQQAEIDRIMASAKRDAEQVILGGSPVATLGTPSGNIEERTEAVQRDYVPGKFRRDKTYVPEFVYDEKRDVNRRVLLKADYRYVLVPQDDFLTYTGNGFKFCKFDGGSQSGLDIHGFDGTYDAVFTRHISGWCQRGDCFLMYIPIRGWEALAAEDLERAQGAEKRALGVFHNAAYSQGIRPFAEVADVEGGDKQTIF